MPEGLSLANEPKIVLYTDDPEIQGLRAQCPLPEASLVWLRADIKERGCIDPIKYAVLDGRNTVIDGYNRIKICEEEKIKYSIQKLEFDSMQAAMNWFIDSQLARRNLTEMQKAFLIGKRYNAEKQAWGGDRKTSGHYAHLATLNDMAEEVKLNEKTIRRHADFAKGIDKLSRVVSPEFTKNVLSGQTKLTINAITALAKKEDPNEIKAEAARIIKGEKPTSAPAPKKSFFDKVKENMTSAFINGKIPDEAISSTIANIDDLIRTLETHKFSLTQRQATLNARGANNTIPEQTQPEGAKA
jgi:hypothetical protein